MRNVSIRLAVLLTIYLYSIGSHQKAVADAFTWKSGQSGDFGDPTNWTPIGVPGQNDVAFLRGSLSGDVTITSDSHAVKNLVLMNGPFPLVLALTGSFEARKADFSPGTIVYVQSEDSSTVLRSETFKLSGSGEVRVEGLTLLLEAFSTDPVFPSLLMDASFEQVVLSFHGPLAHLVAPFADISDTNRLRFLEGSTGTVTALSTSLNSSIEVEGSGSLLSITELFLGSAATIQGGAQLRITNGMMKNGSLLVNGDRSLFVADENWTMSTDQSRASRIDIQNDASAIIRGNLRMSDDSTIHVRDAGSVFEVQDQIVSVGTIRVTDAAKLQLQQVGVNTPLVPGEAMDQTARFEVSGQDSILDIETIALPQSGLWLSEILVTDGGLLRAPLVQAAHQFNPDRTVLQVAGESAQLVVEDVFRVGLPPVGSAAPLGGVAEISNGGQVHAKAAQVTYGLLKVDGPNARVEIANGDLTISDGKLTVTNGATVEVAQGGTFVVRDLPALQASVTSISVANGGKLVTNDASVTAFETRTSSGISKGFVVQDQGSLWRDLGTTLIDHGGFIVRNGGLVELNNLVAKDALMLVETNTPGQTTTLRLLGEHIALSDNAVLSAGWQSRIEVPNGPRIEVHSDQRSTSIGIQYTGTFDSRDSQIVLSGMERPTLLIDGTLLTQSIVFSNQQRQLGQISCKGYIQTDFIDLAELGTDLLSVSGYVQIQERLYVGSDDHVSTFQFFGGSPAVINIGQAIDDSGLRDTIRVASGGVLQSNSWWLASSIWVDGGRLELGDIFTSVAVSGDFTQGANGTSSMSIAGLAPNSGFSQITVNGDLSFAGRLELHFIEAFAPKQGDFFDLFVTQNGSAHLFRDDVEVEVFGLAEGWEYDLTVIGNRLRLYSITDAVAIPETSTWTFCILGSIALVFARFRSTRMRHRNDLLIRRTSPGVRIPRTEVLASSTGKA